MLDSREGKILTKQKNQNYMEYSERNSENSYSGKDDKRKMGKTDNWNQVYTMQDEVADS